MGAADIAPLLAPWLSDAEDREFVARCIATEGPIHHRVASVALIRLLGEALEAAGGAPAQESDRDIPVPFRLPPHLDRHGDEEARYPIRLSRRAVERLATNGSADVAALADAITDGPAHHALANVVMANLLGALLERLGQKGSP